MQLTSNASNLSTPETACEWSEFLKAHLASCRKGLGKGSLMRSHTTHERRTLRGEKTLQFVVETGNPPAPAKLVAQCISLKIKPKNKE